jgi:hypothetical protein
MLNVWRDMPNRFWKSTMSISKSASKENPLFAAQPRAKIDTNIMIRESISQHRETSSFTLKIDIWPTGSVCVRYP